MALADWQLSVLQCLCVPLEWCAKPGTALPMRWLWEAQLDRILLACAEAFKLAGLVPAESSAGCYLRLGQVLKQGLP